MKPAVSTAMAVVFLWFMTAFAFPLPAGAQDCPNANTIVGQGSAMIRTIDCGGGHDCRAPVCGAGESLCCATTGGYVYCTWCDDYYCSIYTVSCT